MTEKENKELNALDRYQAAAGRTANYDTNKIIERLQKNPQLVTLLNDALGLAGEAGEFADHIKKVVYHGHELNEEYSAKELGDLMWYIADAARSLQYALSTIAGKNVQKLKERYPEGFDEQKSINREA